MDQRERLAKLKAEKKRIEEEIRLLSNNVVVFGCAKIDKEHYPTDRPDEWGLYILKKTFGLDRREGWYSVVRSNYRKDVIESIQSIIDSLQGLLEKLRTEGESNDKA